MESQSQSAERKGDSPENEPKKKPGSSGKAAVCYLREKHEADLKLREQELLVQNKKLDVESNKIQNDKNNFHNMFLVM